MSVTTVVKAASFDADVKAALQEFLATYFDGDTHAVNGEDVTFLKADTSFFPRSLPRPLLKPLIVAAQMPGAEQHFYASGIAQQLVWRFTAYDNDRTGRTRDTFSTLLALVFTHCRPELAKAGMKVLKVGQPVALQDPAYEYMVTQRLITLWVLA